MYISTRRGARQRLATQVLMFKDIKVNFEMNMFIEVRRNKKPAKTF